MLLVEALRQFGVQTADGERLEAAGGDSGAQFLRRQIELLQPHLVVEFIDTALTRTVSALSSISARALSDSRSLPIVHQ